MRKSLQDNKTPGAIIIEGHVQGLANVRALGVMGIPVIVVDKNNCIARYSKYCKKFFKCPDYTTEDFIVFLIELGKTEKLNGWVLFPSNDHIVYNLSKNKETINSVYKTVLPDLKTLMKIYDKYELIKSAEQKSIPVPATLSLDELENETDYKKKLTYPLLLKGRNGLTFYKAAGKKVFVVNNDNELKHTVNLLISKIDRTNIILQEIIPFNDSRDVWSFTGFAVNGETKAFWIGTKLREHPAKFGTATMAVSTYNEGVEKSGKQLIEMLNYTGVCEIEFIRDNRDGSFKLIEINPRTWLWLALARYCGVDFTKYIYNYLNGIETEYPTNYLKGIKWMNFWPDFLYSLRSIVKRELSVSSYLDDNKGKVIQAVLDRNDITPFVMMTVLLPYLIYKRT